MQGRVVAEERRMVRDIDSWNDDGKGRKKEWGGSLQAVCAYGMVCVAGNEERMWARVGIQAWQACNANGM